MIIIIIYIIIYIIYNLRSNMTMKSLEMSRVKLLPTVRFHR